MLNHPVKDIPVIWPRAPGRPLGNDQAQHQRLLDAASLLKGVFADTGLDQAALTKHTLALPERGLESPHAH